MYICADKHATAQASSESSETDYDSYDAQTQRSALAASTCQGLDQSSSDASLSCLQRAQNSLAQTPPSSYHWLSCPGMSDALVSDDYEGTDFLFLVADCNDQDTA